MAMPFSLPVLQCLWDKTGVLTLEMIDGFWKQISKKKKKKKKNLIWATWPTLLIYKNQPLSLPLAKLREPDF
jgi:hypothetical protein